jgi:hypothetical protein
MQHIDEQSPSYYDLFRLTKSKREVDISPNTIRAFAKDGLPVYRRGKAVFISKHELSLFLRGRLL